MYTFDLREATITFAAPLFFRTWALFQITATTTAHLYFSRGTAPGSLAADFELTSQSLKHDVS